MEHVVGTSDGAGNVRAGARGTVRADRRRAAPQRSRDGRGRADQGKGYITQASASESPPSRRRGISPRRHRSRGRERVRNAKNVETMAENRTRWRMVAPHSFLPIPMSNTSRMREKVQQPGRPEIGRPVGGVDRPSCRARAGSCRRASAGERVSPSVGVYPPEAAVDRRAVQHRCARRSPRAGPAGTRRPAGRTGTAGGCRGRRTVRPGTRRGRRTERSRTKRPRRALCRPGYQCPAPGTQPGEDAGEREPTRATRGSAAASCTAMTSRLPTRLLRQPPRSISWAVTS